MWKPCVIAFVITCMPMNQMNMKKIKTFYLGCSTQTQKKKKKKKNPKTSPILKTLYKNGNQQVILLKNENHPTLVLSNVLLIYKL
jgi:hypothetical protein